MAARSLPRRPNRRHPRDLVSLYRVEGDADWTAISEIIAELLSDLVAKIEARERGKGVVT